MWICFFQISLENFLLTHSSFWLKDFFRGDLITNIGCLVEYMWPKYTLQLQKMRKNVRKGDNFNYIQKDENWNMEVIAIVNLSYSILSNNNVWSSQIFRKKEVKKTWQSKRKLTTSRILQNQLHILTYCRAVFCLICPRSSTLFVKINTENLYAYSLLKSQLISHQLT